MSQEELEVIEDIAHWYALLGGTFIRVVGRENPLHVLLRYATDKLFMQEVSYHLTTELSATLPKKKKAPRPTLPLQVGLYMINNLKVVYLEEKEIVIFEFDTQYFNLYDASSICKDHYLRVLSVGQQGISLARGGFLEVLLQCLKTP